MRLRKALAWVVPAAVFAAAGFLAVLKEPDWGHKIRHTVAAFTDYGSTTVG